MLHQWKCMKKGSKGEVYDLRVKQKRLQFALMKNKIRLQDKSQILIHFIIEQKLNNVLETVYYKIQHNQPEKPGSTAFVETNRYFVVSH